MRPWQVVSVPQSEPPEVTLDRCQRVQGMALSKSKARRRLAAFGVGCGLLRLGCRGLDGTMRGATLSLSAGGGWRRATRPHPLGAKDEGAGAGLSRGLIWERLETGLPTGGITRATQAV